MGFLDALLGSKKPPSNVETPADQVYLELDAKYAAVRQMLDQRAAAQSASIILVAHFPPTLEELRKIVDASDHESLAILGRDLSPDFAASLRFPETATIDFIVAERHALTAGDQQVIAFAEALPCRSRVAHVLSLDDGLLRLFTGDNIKEMMRKMGQKEDEAIESRMVTRRLLAAQKKLSKCFEADYQEANPRNTTMLEWFEQLERDTEMDPFEPKHL